jgi:hypothetical protein
VWLVAVEWQVVEKRLECCCGVDHYDVHVCVSCW